MIEESLDDLQKSIVKAHESLAKELAKLRTGRANPALLESIRIDYYGTPTPLQQVANIGVPEARMLSVKPWEKSLIKTIEKAIVESGMGFNPQNDGETIRVPMPALTEDRRKELVRFARKQGEDCKVAIRKGRHEAKDVLQGLKESGDASGDDIDRALKKVEEIVQQGTSRADEILARKEKDILEV